ncbi:hypothetical protein RchiOBHm_Chr6g0255831 [Rosa chinensis]|uniref:Uncharacterized protein n=1 Tax=Rosa chinensis TaxID=74649 RepID=A0A2P6PLY6_ROSCH|nr:hypothetical protein RchiOBHm_Chr6g0255831 [Rosa chinensis]
MGRGRLAFGTYELLGGQLQVWCSEGVVVAVVVVVEVMVAVVVKVAVEVAVMVVEEVTAAVVMEVAVAGMVAAGKEEAEGRAFFVFGGGSRRRAVAAATTNDYFQGFSFSTFNYIMLQTQM